MQVGKAAISKEQETLCMKHLLLYLMNKDDEKVAETEIRNSLRLDMRNGICWQILGLFYRHCKYGRFLFCQIETMRKPERHFTLLQSEILPISSCS